VIGEFLMIEKLLGGLVPPTEGTIQTSSTRKVRSIQVASSGKCATPGFVHLLRLWREYERRMTTRP
jgi:hypothetical protein